MSTEIDGVNGIIKNTTSDGDITIKGNDGGSEVSALILDMSDAGTATFNHDVKLGDNSKALFGAGSDLQIYHDGSNSYIYDNGTGDFDIRSNGDKITLKRVADGHEGLRYTLGGSLLIKHNNSTKLETTSTGVDITGAFTATAASTITTADNTDTLSLISTDADANAGPVLNLFRNSGSPADGDVIGRIRFDADDDGGNVTSFVTLEAGIQDASNGSEDTFIDLKSFVAGTERNRLKINATEAVFNEDSVDLDFRVESNGVGHMLFVDGGNDRVGIAYSVPVSTLTVGGQITATAGAVSAPTYSFHSDTNTGMTRPTTETLTLVTAGTEKIRITDGGKVGILESSPDVSDGGLCINQGASDSNILSLKSSDIAHGMTAIAETDTYVKMLKNSDGGGALNLTTLSETATAFRHVACATGSNTAESLAATSVWGVDTRLKDGSSVTGPGADDNIASFRTSDQAQVIFKGDGEIFSNQSATVGTYDAYEDAQLIRAYDLSHMQGVINSKFDKFVQYNKDDLVKARLIGKDEDGNATSFVNWTGMSRLHNGAIWQQYEKHQKLASAFYKLAEKTIGKEEADKLLTEEEIQLLN